MALVVDDVLLAPVTIPAWICKKIHDVGETEMTDTGAIHEELLELQMRFELDELTEEEYQQKEAELLERLEAMRKYKEKHVVKEVESIEGRWQV